MASAPKRKCSSLDPESVVAVATSEIPVTPFSFIWELKNYLAFTTQHKEKSPLIPGGQLYNWQLVVYPNKIIEGIEYVGINLRIVGEGDGQYHSVQISAKFQLSILNAEGIPWRTRGGNHLMVTHVFDTGRAMQGCGWKRFCRSTEITDPANNVLNNGQLTIHCQLWLEGSKRTSIRPGPAAALSLISGSNRKEKFARLFDESLLTDVTVCSSGATYNAHKAILAVMSPVFEAMFRTDMVENIRHCVDIEDFDDDVVKAMLEFMYKGTTDLKRKPLDLFRIADKYGVEDFKKCCEVQILADISIENAAEILKFANMCGSSMMKANVIGYIKCNKEAVKKTEAFQELIQADGSALVDLI